MGGTTDQLKGMFTAAVAAFNDHSMENLNQYLDDNLIVYAISNHNGYHPKHAASVYLQAQFADNPKFELPNPIPSRLNGPEGQATGATIGGMTTWKDTHNPEGEQLLYNFTFVYKNGGWLFSTMWAAAS